jgi:parallel beta-helix repeat protein
VVLLEGTYYIASSINMQSDQSLEGQGRGTYLLVPSANNGTFAIVKNDTTISRSHSRIAHMTIDGNMANNSSGTTTGVRLQGATNWTLEGLHVVNTRGVGIDLNNADYCMVRGCTTNNNGAVLGYGIQVHTTSEYNTIVNCVVRSGLTAGIYLTNAARNVVSGCAIHGSPISIYIDTGANYTTVANCFVEPTSNDGIYAYFASYGTIVGNTVVGGNNAGITVHTSGRFNVTGNTIQAASTGINVQASYSCAIVGNSVTANTLIGIYVSGSGAVDNVVSGNTVAANTFQGIYVAPGAHRTLVGANTIASNGQEGVYVSGATDCRIDNNNFYNNGTTTHNTYDQLRILGTSTKFAAAHNTFRKAGTGNEPRYAIRIESSATDGVALDNDTRTGGVTGQVFNSAPTTTLFIVGSDVHGSRPTAGIAGRVYLPTDAVSLSREDGATWYNWGPIYPFTTPPAAATWAWVNQGSATLTDSGNGVVLYAPPQSGTNNLRIAKKAKTGTYTITVGFIPTIGPTVYGGVGVLWRQSSDGKLVTLRIANTNQNETWDLYKWNTPSSPNAAYTTINGGTNDQNGGNLFRSNLIWLQLIDDGTNRVVKSSNDGLSWVTLHTVGRTDFMTADEVGFWADSTSSNTDAYIRLLSWKEA